MGDKEILYWCKNYPIYDFFNENLGGYDEHSDKYSISNETIDLFIELLNNSLKELESGKNLIDIKDDKIYFYYHNKNDIEQEINILYRALFKQERKGYSFSYRYTT